MAAALTTRPSSGLRIGVIAEDETDCRTLRVLLQKLRGRATRVDIRSANGGGTIKNKGASWVKDLVRAGCSAVIIVHDLDREPLSGQLNQEGRLRAQLASIPVPREATSHICIPIEELEAWFLADEKVLQKVARRPVPAVAQPERFKQPKEELKRLSRDGGKKPRYATTDNPGLAEDLDLDLCAQRCPSFSRLRQFVATL